LLKRLVELSDAHQLTIELAYYPPYHSKYNPVELLCGVLEKHLRGQIIETTKKALGLARSMTYRGIKPSVRKVTKLYRTGISVAHERRWGRSKGYWNTNPGWNPGSSRSLQRLGWDNYFLPWPLVRFCRGLLAELWSSFYCI
jgi:transposase